MLTRPMLAGLVLVAMANRAEQRLSAESDRVQNEVQWFQRQPQQMEQPLAASHVAILAGYGVNLPLTPP